MQTSKWNASVRCPCKMYAYSNDTVVVTHSVYGGCTGIVEMFSCTVNS